jgi:HPt (histidine-containing phosphotransfer) domain-containing protein
MTSDLQARFLPRFLSSSRERVRRARDACAEGGDAFVHVVAVELHALAGEASLLDLPEIGALAREGESVARKSELPAAASSTCRRLLRDLDAALDALDSTREQ